MMRCPECVKTGQRSTFHGSRSGFSTAMAEDPDYYDEDGNLHCHRRNTYVTTWYCSNDHHFRRTQLMACPTCPNYGRDDWELYEPHIESGVGQVTFAPATTNTLIKKRLTIRDDGDGLPSIGVVL